MTLILGIAAVAAIGVPMNALFFQDGRHPAPLFSSQPLPAVITAPTPPPRPAVIEAARTERDSSQRAAPDAIAEKIEKTDVAKGGPAKPDTPRMMDKKRDAISSLILSEAPPRAASAHKNEKAPAADNNSTIDGKVLFAQRALLKLGYVVRADGMLSSATRQALEKFERDIGLPAKGQITPKLLRQLAARSSLPLP